MTYRYDVVIAGAGPAGIAAAVEAAESGRKTALLERYGAVGGNLTLGFVGPFMGNVSKGTMAERIEALLKPEGRNHYNYEEAKYVLMKLLFDAGVDVFLQMQVTSCEKEGEKLTSVTAVSKGTPYRFEAPVFIDATGDGDLAALAGCEVMMGREEDGLCQPMSFMFQIENVAPWQKLECCHEEHYTVLSNGKEYLSLCHEACRDGRLPPTCNIVRLYAMENPDERMVNATQYNGGDPLDPRSLARADYELRRQAEMIVGFLKENVPGFEEIRIKSGASTVGVRESRRIKGHYVLSAEDLIEGRRFPDAVVHEANFPIDIHNPAGAGQAVGEEICPVTAKPYDIPFRAMRPLHVSNLITAGRCISGTHEAHASYRIMRIVMAMGQAAGAAASLMGEKGLSSTAELDADLLRARLISRGVVLE